MSTIKPLRGGEFLTKEVESQAIFIPEEFDEETNMITDSCQDFLDTEIFPNLESIDKQTDGLMASLLKKAGDLGLLGLSVPEEYGGFEQSFLSIMRANEALGAAHSYSVAIMAHTGIGTLPILYYGNEEQKAKYIPKLTTGELMAAYCLTEPGAGSDANSGRTKAVLSEDGKHYILNGQKMWITNGGFADIQTVFAKVDNDRVLSAFIVERAWEGVTMNPEEKKMGIKGSSTRQIFYNDVKVPVENMLGKRGEGFRIALNILHLGRIKLGATVVGGAKRAILYSVNYANERKQFGKTIASFGAIKHKLAQQVIKTFATESAVYRASKDIQDYIGELKAQGFEHGKANIEGVADYAVECALLKVYGSESLDYVVDEAVQIYGGMGFSSETPVDRAYRDSRINRIFEGTNEINRLLAVDALLKKGAKNDSKLFEIAKKMAETADSPIVSDDSEYFGRNMTVIRNLKKSVLMLIPAITATFGRKIAEEEEVLMNISDMLMQVYAAEATVLRVEKLETLKGGEALPLYRDILDILMHDVTAAVYKAGFDAVVSFTPANEAEKLQKALFNLCKTKAENVKDARRRIADKLIDDNAYKF
ncbi:MAG: acyl-CoA dehydrogenase family protein [Bacteroidetes bacterium]|nr:acyl-CoA dehydrogenase family protein [Bacteroidota bacterium]MBU1579930.1 acyl-CoA dehydrogenase family protein [Bacteroidota bacterium]MBU2466423.1 acyl-CoA dehydrogenase family protein [Bacteroidota bacterium]MBU2556606.1 acyl-CoA dehydrogenase family protein [Bacteroidota bacterium]